MKEINFYKFQGTGNDFIIIDQMNEKFDLSTDEISSLCHRRLGIGADGLIFLRSSLKADFKMVYYNSDGNESTMCGNGGRCIGMLFYQLFPENGKKFSVQAIDGIHAVEILNEETVALQMNDVHAIEENENYIELNTGSPHYVAFRKDIFNLDVNKEGAQVRNSDKYAKQGINVNFVEMEDEFIAVRTFERGVEAETLSCGTGVTAAAISADLCSEGKYGNAVSVHTRGGTLEVKFEKENSSYKNIWLVGPASQVFQGRMKLK
jgi:diaminopimelate epimerase